MRRFVRSIEAVSSPLDLLPEAERLAAFDGLAARALADWNLQPISLERIAYRENAVYAVQVDRKRRVALRVHRHGYHDRAALESELAWMSALSLAGVATPQVIRTPAGSTVAEITTEAVPVPHLCDLLEWVEGRPVGSVEQRAAREAGSLFGIYRGVGRIAAQIHSHSAVWQPPADFVRPHWDREGCLGERALWGPWFQLDALGGPDRSRLAAAVEVIDGTLRRYGANPQVYGMVHCDFVPENLIEDGGRVTLIDFDDSGYGWYLWELATAVFWYLGTPEYRPALEGYVSGYREVRPLSDDELRLLPQFLLMRALVYMGWMQTRRTQQTARLMTARVCELSLAIAEHVLAGSREYRSIELDLAVRRRHV